MLNSQPIYITIQSCSGILSFFHDLWKKEYLFFFFMLMSICEQKRLVTNDSVLLKHDANQLHLTGTIKFIRWIPEEHHVLL